jgi:tryptophanyl-tRNA synthetase
MATGKRIIVSGMRPTGRLHLGNLHGALVNMIALQQDPQNRCFYFSADWHALTTGYADPKSIRQDEREMLLDWLACGLDPARATIFVQSRVKAHAELLLLLGMVVPLPWLERVPTFKEQQAEMVDRELNTYGFLGYPLLQTADIIIYKATHVPVGHDQLPHLELSREVARRFNHHYGPVFLEPEPLLTAVPKVWGTDGRKMSKSYGNSIIVGEDEESTRKKIMTAVTDPARVHRSDPGEPTKCGIYYLHRLYSTAERVADVETGCRSAGIGCVECKRWLLEKLLPAQAVIREKRAEVAAHPEVIDELLESGNRKASEAAEATMTEVRAAMHLS